jgi:hypothetical protein
MKTRNIFYISALGALLTTVAQADVLFSTGFTSSSTTTDTIAFNGTTTSVGQHGITGAGSNANANFWTVTDATKVDVGGANLVTNGTNAWGNASGSSGDRIFKGELFATSTSFGILNAGAQAVRIPGSTNTAANAFQFNNSGNHDGYINMIFEVKSGNIFDNLSVGFKGGTASTAGVFDNNDAAQNGNYNVSLFNLDSNGLMGSEYKFYESPKAFGAGAGVAVTATASDAAHQITSGLYLLQIQLTGKTQTQRFTIDDLSFNGTAYSAVPEPTSALAGLLIGSGLLRRRRA